MLSFKTTFNYLSGLPKWVAESAIGISFNVLEMWSHFLTGFMWANGLSAFNALEFQKRPFHF